MPAGLVLPCVRGQGQTRLAEAAPKAEWPEGGWTPGGFAELLQRVGAPRPRDPSVSFGTFKAGADIPLGGKRGN